MAFDSFTEFYVTKHGSASNTNGGSGAGDGITVADVTAVHDGAGSHTLTDNGVDGFAGTIVDDFICWDTAGASEWARVTAVTSDDVIVVLNMTGALAFANLANKAVEVGGAWATVDHAASTLTTSFVNAAGNPPRVNIGPGTYAEEVTIDNAGTTAIPLTFEGYYSTVGDECMNGATFDPPIIAGPGGAGLAGTIYAASGKNYLRFRNLKVTAQTNGKEAFNCVTAYSLFDRLWVNVTGTVASGISNTGAGCLYKNIYVETSSAYGILVGGTSFVTGCYVRSAYYAGIYLGTGSGAINCVVEGVTDDCVIVSGNGSLVYGCALYQSSGGSGVRIPAPSNTSVINTIFDTMNQYGIEAGAAGFITEANNSFRSCTQGVRNANILSDPVGNTTHGAIPFTNAAGHDFSLNSAATGGALLKAAGFPGTMLDGTNIGYMDIGALQVEAAAGGGAAAGPFESGIAWR